MGKEIRENIMQFVVGNVGDVKSELVIYVWYESSCRNDLNFFRKRSCQKSVMEDMMKPSLFLDLKMIS